MEEVVIERMAPSSLKKMSGSGARKEGNYASSNESTSLDVSTSDDLGLTLLPGPQTQKKVERAKEQAAVGRHSNICTTEPQEDGQPRVLELDGLWHPVKRRSIVDESIGGSFYFGLSNGVERYSCNGSHDDDAVVRPDECCSGIQGKRDLKRNDFSLSTERLSKDIRDGLVKRDRDLIAKQSGATHASSLAKKGRETDPDLLFNSSNQMLKAEVKIIGLSEANGSLESVVGNKHDSGRKSDSTACENSLKYEFCGSKGKKSENLLRIYSSANLGMTFTKPITDNTLSTSYHLSRPNDSVKRPHHSARLSENQFTCPAITERENHSHIASAFLAPVELQGSSKVTAPAYQQALNSLQLSPQQILKQPQASRNLHAAPPKKVSKPVKQLKRSWTRHFPIGSKDLPSRGLNSDHAHTSSATLSFLIGSETHSSSLKTYFARENRCKLLAYPNPRTLATSPLLPIKTFSRASYGSKRHTFDNRSDTGIVQSRSKAGNKRSNSLPELCLPHQTSIMYQQHRHQANQFSTPPTEPYALGDNSQYPGSNHTFLAPNQEAHPGLGEIHGDINMPLMGIPYPNMQGNFSQPSQSLANPNMGAPTYGYPPIQLPVHGSDNQTLIDYPVSTNDGFPDSNSERLYTTAECMALANQCIDQSRRLQVHSQALDNARERDRISQAKIKEQERMIVALRQKSETTKTAKPPKKGGKTKSSGNGSVASTINWARQSYPIAGQQNTNARSASLDSSPIQLRDQNDNTFLESGADILTMFSPTQSQPASVPAVATGLPTQATPFQAPYSGSFQPGPEYLLGLHHPAHPSNPVYSPYPHPLGQYFYPGSLAEDPFLNQETQFQQSSAHYSAENYQQSPQFPVPPALPAAAQAEASTTGIKRKREAEPDVAQAVKRQQQPVESQPGVSRQEETAEKDHDGSEAWRKMSQKPLDWLQGFHPYQHKSNDRQQQFGTPSASLPQANPLPALAAQAPMGLIAPTPGKAPRKTTQKTPNKRREPKSAAEKKAAKARHNKNYRESTKEKKRIEKMQATENGEASGTASPPFNADNDEDGLHDSVEEENDGNDQISISDDDDLFDGSSIPEETTTHDATEESYNNTDPENPLGLSAEDLAWITEEENRLMLEDEPTDQAVEDATEETIERITEVEDEESEESEEGEESEEE